MVRNGTEKAIFRSQVVRKGAYELPLVSSTGLTAATAFDYLVRSLIEYRCDLGHRFHIIIITPCPK